MPVRLFPRRVDALLLGGLRNLVGGDYAKYRAIRARYRLDGARVSVRDVIADGRSLIGRVDLTAAARCGSGIGS